MDSNTVNLVVTIIGYVLFSISEILPLLPIKTSGLLHTMILGFRDAFKSPDKDIELVMSFIHGDKSLVSMVNTLGTNAQLKQFVESVVQNPQTLHNMQTIGQMTVDELRILDTFRSKPDLFKTVDNVVNNTT